MRQSSSAAAVKQPLIPSILLIDDNEGDIELARHAFEQAHTDYEITYLTSAFDALKHLQQPNVMTPSLILLDLNMPGMNGKEFLEDIKHNEKFSSIPVILLTSSGAPQDIQDCYRLHASGYIVKPSTASERAAMVSHVAKFLNEA